MQSSEENLRALSAAVLVDPIPDIGLGHSQAQCSFTITVKGGVTFKFTRHTYSQVSDPWVQYTVSQNGTALDSEGESCIYVYNIPLDTGDPAGCRAALSGALAALAATEPKMRVAIQWTPTGRYV